MNFREASSRLGIEKYPEKLDAFAKSETNFSEQPWDTEQIRFLQETEDLFGKYYDLVFQAALDLTKDPIRMLWAQVVSAYIARASCTEALAIPVPESDGSVLGDMLPLLVMLPSVPNMKKMQVDRKIDPEMTRRYMGTFRGCMGIVETKVGRPGLNKTYFNWTMLYLKGMIFTLGGFNFELKQLPESVMFLKNKKSGTIIPLMRKGVFHASGMVLGAAGFLEEEGSFAADFEETEDGYYGHEARDGFVLPERKSYLKKDWECVVWPGCCVLSMHIPRKTDISGEAFDRAVAMAVEFASRYYAEYHPVCLYCSSWLLDPTLAEVVGNEAKITKFGEKFIRYPNKSAGKEVYSFVFPPRIQNLNDLPENTRLERGLKKRYLEGGFVHGFAGIRLFDPPSVS